jgi:uncharacterized membrane protein YfcA
VVFSAAWPVAMGSIVGGWAGASVARRVDPKHVRTLVLVVAWTLTVCFFWSSFARS